MKQYEYGVFVVTDNGEMIVDVPETSIYAALRTVDVQQYKDRMSLGYARRYVVRPREIITTHGEWMPALYRHVG